jgi:hypothetical protein
MAEAYNPSPEARDAMRRSFAASFMSPNSDPVEMVSRMSIRAIEVDFNGSVSSEQNEAIMAFSVAFMSRLVEAIRDHIGQNA